MMKNAWALLIAVRASQPACATQQEAPKPRRTGAEARTRSGARAARRPRRQ